MLQQSLNLQTSLIMWTGRLEDKARSHEYFASLPQVVPHKDIDNLKFAVSDFLYP